MYNLITSQELQQSRGNSGNSGIGSTGTGCIPRNLMSTVQEWMEIVQDMTNDKGENKKNNENENAEEYRQFLHVAKALLQQLTSNQMQKYILSS